MQKQQRPNSVIKSEVGKLDHCPVLEKKKKKKLSVLEVFDTKN